MRARLLLALGAVLWVGFPSTAFGATAFVEIDDGIDGRILWYQAAPGETNQLEVTHVDPNTTIRDPGAVITAGPGCTSISANEVSCANINYFVSADLGDGNDEAFVVEDSALSALGVNIGGGSGSDELSACDACSPSLYGGGGSDILTGSLVEVELSGGGGNDLLTTGAGGTLDGGGGNDTITGGDRRNAIWGRGGDDTISAGQGNDVIEPGPGDDSVDAGPGRDEVSYDRLSAPVVVNLRIGQATSGEDVDTLVSITNIKGTRHFSDRLIGDEQDNRLHGGMAGFSNHGDVLIGGGGNDLLKAGEQLTDRRGPEDDDRLVGGAGNDLLKAGGGGDVLVGGSGRDTINGGGGDDFIRARDGTRDVVRGGPHVDRASVDVRLDDVSGVEIFFVAAQREPSLARL